MIANAPGINPLKPVAIGKENNPAPIAHAGISNITVKNDDMQNYSIFLTQKSLQTKNIITYKYVSI